MKRIGAVANAFLDKSDKISLLKLLKLCYIAQGFSLAILNRAIFEDDHIEAWRYGPVIPSLYHEFKYLKGDVIGAKRSIITDFNRNFEIITETPKLTDENDKKIIEIVWNMYGKYTANELVSMTHKTGTPWDLVYIPNENRVIPIDLIKKYYKMLVEKM